MFAQRIAPIEMAGVLLHRGQVHPMIYFRKLHGLDWWKDVRAERFGLEWDRIRLRWDRIFLFLGYDDLVLERIHIVET